LFSYPSPAGHKVVGTDFFIMDARRTLFL
jgi:hypothetical protein